jgi:YegS/Rv2252/BmrU family lipid kinase
MNGKKACIVINPRAGQNIVKLPDMLAIFAAAGWKTDIAIKEYGGQIMELATKAAEKNYDLVIGYGGDGTLCQVVNGVMNAKGQHSRVALIPGGTANVWASEVGIPVDPVKAALTLVSSECHKVDIGHVEIESLTLPGTPQDEQTGAHVSPHEQQMQERKVKATPTAKHHFMLMAGLGIDAAVMGHVSKPLKYKIGPLAVGLSAAKELPAQHPFPVEIRASAGGRKGEVLWKGEAIQVVIGNTRRYADVVEMTPNAYIDDGILDVCVITAGDPLSTLQQISSLLLRRHPDNTSAEYFHGAHLSISAPASVDMQLDGSAIKLKDYLSKADRAALQQADNLEQIMVNYRFDVMPRALRVAIPSNYDDALFEHSLHEEVAHEVNAQEQSEQEKQGKQTSEQQDEDSSHKKDQHSAGEAKTSLSQLGALMDNGREVTVIGATKIPAKKRTYIIAGTSLKQNTGEIKPVAVRIDEDTTIIKRTGEHVSPAFVLGLPEGEQIVVEGKKSKRGVIRATRMLV